MAPCVSVTESLVYALLALKVPLLEDVPVLLESGPTVDPEIENEPVTLDVAEILV